MAKKGFSLVIMHELCTVYDPVILNVLKVNILGRSFSH